MSRDHAVATRDSHRTGHDALDAEHLAWDLAGVTGILGEIATCWRRAHTSLPDLPLALPLELAEKAWQAGAGIRGFAGADLADRAGLALIAVRRIAWLREACEAAAALTRPADADIACDRQLWESATRTLRQAGIQSLSILLRTSAVTDWSLDERPGDEPGTWLHLRVR